MAAGDSRRGSSETSRGGVGTERSRLRDREGQRLAESATNDESGWIRRFFEFVPATGFPCDRSKRPQPSHYVVQERCVGANCKREPSRIDRRLSSRSPRRSPHRGEGNCLSRVTHHASRAREVRRRPCRSPWRHRGAALFRELPRLAGPWIRVTTPGFPSSHRTPARFPRLEGRVPTVRQESLDMETGREEPPLARCGPFRGPQQAPPSTPSFPGKGQEALTLSKRARRSCPPGSRQTQWTPQESAPSALSGWRRGFQPACPPADFARRGHAARSGSACYPSPRTRPPRGIRCCDSPRPGPARRR